MKNSVWIMICGLFPFYSAAQEGSPVLEKIAGKLEVSQQVLPLEEVYVQTDKDVYAPGEIIWLGGLVYERTENKPSGHSQEITVNLYDASGKLVMGDNFPLVDGKISGDLLLPEEMTLGHYYLAAYTPSAVNTDNVYIKPLTVDLFYESDALVTFVRPDKIYHAGAKAGIELGINDFNGNPVDKFPLNYEIRHGNKKIADGKIRSEKGKAEITALFPQQTGKEPVELIVSHPRNLWTKRIALKTSADQIDLKFYVEGGSLIGGVPQKIGFRATAWNGTPVDLEADVTDASGKVVSKTKTFSPGFGIFPFKPDPGEKYTLTITSEYGKGESFDLPVAGGASDFALTVAKSEKDFLSADLLALNKNPRNLAITATRGYQLLWAANLEVNASSRIKIPVSELGSGLVLLSVFDESGNSLSSRLIYLPEKNNLELGINPVSTPDGKLKITITTADHEARPVPATVILSVADTLYQIHSGNNFSGSLYLNGELKNPYEEAGLLLKNPSGKEVVLDYLLICNELKNFSWGRVLKATGDKKRMVQPDNSGISGRVTDKKGNPVPNAKISMMNSRERQLFSVKADEKGIFHYPSLQPAHIGDFTITAADRNGKGSYQVALDSTFSDKVGTVVKALDYRISGREATREQTGRYLASNPDLIHAQPVKKQVAAGNAPLRPEPYKMMLQSGSNLLDVIRTIKPFSIYNNQIVFYGTINSINAQSGALIVVDGQKMGTTIDVLNTISPNDVEKINISLEPMDIQRYTGLNNVGVIEITTKRGEAPVSQEAFRPKENLYRDGYRIPRNFLTTDALRSKSGKDLRTTLYWNPCLVIGPSGTTTFSIPLSEIKSGFVISAEGIDLAGHIGQAQQVITVR